MGSACFELFVVFPRQTVQESPKNPQESPSNILKNNIRLAHGTPIDSERFRQAVNIRKRRCADKYCCIDCQSLHTVCRYYWLGRPRACGRGGLLYCPTL